MEDDDKRTMRPPFPFFVNQGYNYQKSVYL